MSSEGVGMELTGVGGASWFTLQRKHITVVVNE